MNNFEKTLSLLSEECCKGKCEKIDAETFQLEKGLTREEARKLTLGKIKKDHRGFSYNPKTGIAKYI